jgi:predicted hydrocarbon binding protein
MSSNVEVYLFYSGTENPHILKQYQEGIAYLHEINAKLQIIDIDKNPEKAVRFKIVATPTIRIKTSDTDHRFVGVTDGFKQLLLQNLHGKGVLHVLGFKEGRELGKTLQVDMDNREEVERLLREELSPRGFYEFKLEIYKPNVVYVEASLIPDEMVEEYGKSKIPAGFKIAAFLGGIFTELFKKEVTAEETQSMTQGYEKCVFKIMQKEEPEGEIKERIRRMMK